MKQIGAEQAFAIEVDTGNVEAITTLVQQAVAKLGKIDIVVTTAGSMYFV